MSGHADTIRRALRVLDGSKFMSNEFPTLEDGKAATAALDALEAELIHQADRIAWLEGDVAGWRIKLAECEERHG